MLKIFRYIFSFVAMAFAVYGLVMDSFEFQPYMLFFLGLMLLAMGLEEFQKEQKASGWFLIIVALLLSFNLIQSLF